MTIKDPGKSLRRLFEEVINKGNFSVTDELISTQFRNYGLNSPAQGREGFKQLINMFRSAFPDLKVTLEDVISTESKAVSRGYWTGTHKGEFLGIHPTQKTVKVSYIDIWECDSEGRFTSNYVTMDMLGLTEQLGVVNAPTRELEYHN
jgi:predicted ester cyclase